MRSMEGQGCVLVNLWQLWKRRLVSPKSSLHGMVADLRTFKVMATVVREFDLEFAPGYLANTEMNSTEATPRYVSPSRTHPRHTTDLLYSHRYQDSLTLPMVSPSYPDESISSTDLNSSQLAPLRVVASRRKNL
jgi:hypothetical protein